MFPKVPQSSQPESLGFFQLPPPLEHLPIDDSRDHSCCFFLDGADRDRPVTVTPVTSAEAGIATFMVPKKTS